MGIAATDPAPAQSPLARHGALLATLVIITIAVAAFFTIPALRHCVTYTLHGNLAGLRRYIRSLGFDGLVLLIALMLVHAIVPYPSEILTTTAGYVYGFGAGLAVAIGGWTLCALLSYLVGASIGGPVLRALLGRRFSDLQTAMEKGGVELMLIWRLLPVVPFSLLGYAQGATRRSLWTLEWTSFIGYLPLTAAVAYLGSQAKSLSASNPLVWLAVVAVIGALIGARLLIRRGGGPAG